MNFKFYDILSCLVPGFILYIAYLQLAEETFDNDFIIPATAIAFVIGYFINTIASWLEDFYYWTWGGKPSNQLLDGKDIWKVKFYEYIKVKGMLLDECSNLSPKNDELFSLAMKYSTSEANSRVTDFNANYAFSRVILTTILIASWLLIYKYYDSYTVYIIILPLIFISWYRCKQRGYYYAREVLNTYLKIKDGSEK
jgi:hypothetical protein